MQQEIVQIGEVNVPVIIENGIKYYPIKYISEKVLLRKGNIISKQNIDQYNEDVKIFSVSYEFVDGGIQDVRCVSEDGLRKCLDTVRLGRLDVDQRVGMNNLLQSLELELVNTQEQFINKLNKSMMKGYNAFLKDAIGDIEGQYDEWQRCSKCNHYYPYHENFFKRNLNSTKEYNTYCRDCSGWNENRMKDSIRRCDSYLTNIYKKYGNDVYLHYRNHDTIKIYQHYLEENMKTVPQLIQNKDDYLMIIKYLYNLNKINEYDISSEALQRKFKLNGIHKILTVTEIHFHLFGDNFYFYPWKYPKFRFSEIELTYELANRIFKNYIEEYKIQFQNPLTFEYEAIFKEVRLTELLKRGLLELIVRINDKKYPGYMFKVSSGNYYKNKENVLFDLKYLIERDLKIPCDKIPLYLTKNVLQQRCSPLYRHIVQNRNGSIFEWVNQLYPDNFIEADFEINPYRNEFDSDTEMYIHEILNEMYGNVIYNQKHADRTITIDGMIPDWMVFTSQGVWIVEYFGMYDLKHKENNRIRDYIEKTHRKIEKYKQVRGYNFIYLYPDDIEDDYFGCREKLRKIGLGSIVSMV